MMKKKVTSKVAEQFRTLYSQLAKGENDGSIDKQAICMELYRLKDEYDVKDRVFEKGGKKGVADITGRVLVPAIYCGISETYDYSYNEQQPIPVYDNKGKQALVKCDGTGCQLSDFEYDGISLLCGSPSYFICGKRDDDGKMFYGVLDKEGNTLVPCEMIHIDMMFNGYSLLYADGKIGALSIDGKYIAPQFDELENEDVDFLRGRKGNSWGYVDNDGEFIDD